MIKFGTDGWRALIAEDFTFENVRFAALGTAKYLLKKYGKDNLNLLVVIGYDTRFLSDKFALEVALVIASKGIKVLLADSISSTPQVSFATLENKANIGIVITASHNPAEYSGYKIKGSFGGPSDPQEIADIEKEVNKAIKKADEKKDYKLKLKTLTEYQDMGLISFFDAKTPYLKYLKKKIKIKNIKDSGLKIIYDPMYGAGIDTLNKLLPDITEIHFDHNPGFGNVDHPEPIDLCLQELIGLVKKNKFDFGFATDGDADRLGLVDEKGNFVDSHKIFMIMLKYLYETKGLKGKVAKTVSLTSMVDLYCQKHNIELIKTAVGFKYIAKLMVEDDILIGGEESGGLSTKLHIPERDGIFNSLLVLEIMVATGKSLKQLCDELDKEFGVHRYSRRDVKVTESIKASVLNEASSLPQKIGRFNVVSIDKTDGYKFFVEDGWLLIRASGTEPLLRFYAEMSSLELVNEILDEAQKMGQ